MPLSNMFYSSNGIKYYHIYLCDVCYICKEKSHLPLVVLLHVNTVKCMEAGVQYPDWHSYHKVCVCFFVAHIVFSLSI